MNKPRPVGARFIAPSWIIAPSVLLALLAAGCSHPATPAPKDAPNSHLAVTLDITPTPATSLDPTRFMVHLRDAAKNPVRGASVKINLDMPAMPMGDNSQTLSETKAGDYGGTGRFTMAGTWRVTVTASAGPEQTIQGFPVQVR